MSIINNASEIYYTPLSNNMIECIRTSHFTVITDNESASAIDTTTLSEPDAESIHLTEYKNGVENLAAQAFTNASNCHFSLERIYKNSIDFSYNEEMLNTLVDKLAFYLEIK